MFPLLIFLIHGFRGLPSAVCSTIFTVHGQEMTGRIQPVNRKGFTLLEIIAVLIILGVLIAVAVPRYFGIPQDAAETALKTAVSELNARDNLAWGKWKTDKTEYTADDIKSDLKGFAVDEGNSLLSSDSFNRQARVSRTPRTDDKPGKWEIIEFIN